MVFGPYTSVTEDIRMSIKLSYNRRELNVFYKTNYVRKLKYE